MTSQGTGSRAIPESMISQWGQLDILQEKKSVTTFAGVNYFFSDFIHAASP